MRLFISRQLSQDSPIRKLATDHKWELIDQSLIDIKIRTLQELPHADWYFFYSKNGVKSYLKYRNTMSNKTNDKNIKLAAIGPGTATFMIQNDLVCSFAGDGGTDQTESDFLEVSKNDDSILFFRAENSANRLMKTIKPFRKVQSVIAYDNDMVPTVFPPVDIVVLTSSRNARAFLKANPTPKQKIIAIGHPTYDTLLSLSIPSTDIIVAEEPSEEGILKALLKIMNNKDIT
ncbi:uroporphyrinogen-III synthase [Membranihabitans maritimus]|uniref:uroporphyrinogen-III synthase n=1 Tax=Membranihabitans maritimus TaxID=2904244 RepID=UPI001F370406|nr:uroporphyrinogen-III synthase [Membranihabitans maritimus]